MRKWALALALSALHAGGFAAETYRVGRWELSLALGGAIPMGATGDLMKPATTLQLTGACQVHRWATAGLDLGWQFGHKLGGTTAGSLSQDYNRDGLNDRVAFGSNIREKILQLTPFIKLGQWMDVVSYKFRPYTLLGAGLYHEWTNSGLITINGRDETSGRLEGPIYLTRDRSSNSYFGFNGGGGFEVQVDENAALGFDLRYSRIIRPYEDFEYLTPSLRILYLF